MSRGYESELVEVDFAVAVSVERADEGRPVFEGEDVGVLGLQQLVEVVAAEDALLVDVARGEHLEQEARHRAVLLDLAHQRLDRAFFCLAQRRGFAGLRRGFAAGGQSSLFTQTYKIGGEQRVGQRPLDCPVCRVSFVLGLQHDLAAAHILHDLRGLLDLRHEVLLLDGVQFVYVEVLAEGVLLALFEACAQLLLEEPVELGLLDRAFLALVALPEDFFGTKRFVLDRDCELEQTPKMKLAYCCSNVRKESWAQPRSELTP